MDSLDTVVQQLKNLRRDLLEQVDRINTALAGLDPQEPIQPRPSIEQQTEKILVAVGDRELSTTEVAKATGIPSGSIHKYLGKLVDADRLVLRKVNNVNHYRQPREEIRVVAGEGITDRKAI